MPWAVRYSGYTYTKSFSGHVNISEEQVEGWYNEMMAARASMDYTDVQMMCSECEAPALEEDYLCGECREARELVAVEDAQDAEVHQEKLALEEMRLAAMEEGYRRAVAAK